MDICIYVKIADLSGSGKCQMKSSREMVLNFTSETVCEKKASLKSVFIKAGNLKLAKIFCI